MTGRYTTRGWRVAQPPVLTPLSRRTAHRPHQNGSRGLPPPTQGAQRRVPAGCCQRLTTHILAGRDDRHPGAQYQTRLECGTPPDYAWYCREATACAGGHKVTPPRAAMNCRTIMSTTASEIPRRLLDLWRWSTCCRWSCVAIAVASSSGVIRLFGFDRIRRSLRINPSSILLHATVGLRLAVTCCGNVSVAVSVPISPANHSAHLQPLNQRARTLADERGSYLTVGRSGDAAHGVMAGLGLGQAQP
jgi:hypothetical protein